MSELNFLHLMDKYGSTYTVCLLFLLSLISRVLNPKYQVLAFFRTFGYSPYVTMDHQMVHDRLVRQLYHLMPNFRILSVRGPNPSQNKTAITYIFIRLSQVYRKQTYARCKFCCKKATKLICDIKKF